MKPPFINNTIFGIIFYSRKSLGEPSGFFKATLKKYLFIILFILPVILVAQSTENSNPKKLTKSEKAKIKKEEKELKEAHKAEERAKKHYREIQTKEVRKRMKESRRKARKNNERKEEFFLFNGFISKTIGIIRNGSFTVCELHYSQSAE